MPMHVAMDTDNSANNIECIFISTALLLESVNQILFKVSL